MMMKRVRKSFTDLLRIIFLWLFWGQKLDLIIFVSSDPTSSPVVHSLSWAGTEKDKIRTSRVVLAAAADD